MVSAFWLIQENKTATHVPSLQTANNLDHFRKEKGRRTKPRNYDDGNLPLEHPAALKAVTEVSGVDRMTVDRYNSATYEKSQLVQLCSNPHDETAEPPMDRHVDTDDIPHEDFFKIVRPSFNKDCDDEEDIIAAFKRSAIVVFLGKTFLVRRPTSERIPVNRFRYPGGDKGMVSVAARPLYSQYKKGQLTKNPDSYHSDLQWSLNLLQACLDGETLPKSFTILGTELDGRKFIEEVRPELSGISGKTRGYMDEDPTKKTNKQAVQKGLRKVTSAAYLLPRQVASESFGTLLGIFGTYSCSSETLGEYRK